MYTKNIYIDQRSSQTISSNRTFTDTNPGIKNDHISIKTIFPIKTSNET